MSWKIPIAVAQIFAFNPVIPISTSYGGQAGGLGTCLQSSDRLGRERQRRPARGQCAGQMGRDVQGGTGEASGAECPRRLGDEIEAGFPGGKVKSLSRVRLFATPWTVPYQAPPSMGFSRQECWSGLPQ